MYLEQRAEEDALFAKKYRNPAKNMDECVTHILNYVQKSGCNGFTDGEIFGQAIHYYEENEIEVGKPMDCQVVSVALLADISGGTWGVARNFCIFLTKDRALLT